MAFSPAILTRWAVVAGLVLAAASPVCAQSAGRGPGQPILFSSTDDDGVSSDMPSLAAQPPGSWDFANAIQSPAQESGDWFATRPLPAPPLPAISPGQARQMQQLLDEQKNWALLTPEQILGPPTREKTLGIADRDAFGQPKNETAMMQYLERQEQLRVHTNDVSSDAANQSPRRGFWDSMGPQMNLDYWNPTGARAVDSGLMRQLIGGTPDSRADADQNSKGIWQKSFNMPVPEPKPTPEQQAAMNQFQELLRPHSLSSGAPNATSLGAPILSAQATALNPANHQASAIPMGSSFTPLASGVAMPAGLTPLPGLLGPTNSILPVLAPEWKPQPPPWLSSTPQLDSIPQRKF